MKIALVSAWFPLAISRYFEAALRRNKSVELITIGTYTDNWIPWDGGMNLPSKYAIQPDIQVDPTVGSGSRMRLTASFQEILDKLPWEPDMWLQVDGLFSFIDIPPFGENVFVAVDPHCRDYGIQRMMADRFYNMQTPYMQEGDLYLPYAYDPVWHAKEDGEHEYDAVLLGMAYPQRNDWVQRLRDNGLSVRYEVEPIYDEARAIYAQTNIGLNWSSLKDLNARVFELLGFGKLAIVNRVPDIDKFFVDGKDLIVFNTLDEAVQKTLYYKNNPVEAEAIAKHGHDTVAKHTWDERIKQIIEGRDFKHG